MLLNFVMNGSRHDRYYVIMYDRVFFFVIVEGTTCYINVDWESKKLVETHKYIPNSILMKLRYSICLPRSSLWSMWSF